MNEESDLGDGVRVDRVIGQGAMAILLRGRLEGREGHVAVKLLHPKHMANDEISDRFRLEGEALASLKSPFLPEVYRMGTTESGQAFIVMELLEGRDLEAMLADHERLPVRDAVRYVREACAALACVHEAGIVHRDVKPANIFVAKLADGDDRVKLLDFGIAKLSTRFNAKRTSMQMTMGTAYYMAPEQVRTSALVDSRADIWALGVVLFELLTRELPFDGPTPLAIMHAILHEPPPRFSFVFGEFPQGLDGIVRKALEKDPSARFATANELSRALAPYAALIVDPGPALVDESPVRSDRPPPTQSETTTLAALAAALPRQEDTGDRVALTPSDLEAWLAEVSRRPSGTGEP